MKNSPRILLLASSRKSQLATVITVTLVFGGLLWFGVSHSGEADKAPAADKPMWTVQGDRITIPADSPLRKRLSVAPVGLAVAEHGIDIPGMVEADPATQVNVNPPLTGKLTELRVRLGDAIKAGQVLAVISSPDMSQAFSDDEKAHDALDLAKRALDRGTGVNSAGANATKDLEQLHSNYNQALAEFNRAEQRLKSLGASNNTNHSSPGSLTLAAPVAGTITAINSGVGSYLNDPTATLMTIANLDHVWVTANVPENLISAVKAGQVADVSLDAYPGQAWQGKVYSVSAVLESDTHRNKVRISFKNADGRLKPNMYATVRLAVPQNGKLTIPTSALLMNNDSITVFVEVAPWTFVRRSVIVGGEDGEMANIVSGLAAGDRIVTRGGVLIND